MAPTTPRSGSNSREPHALAQYERHQRARLGAERATNPELAHALRDAIADHPVKTDRGDEHRRAGESEHHPRDQAVGSDVFLDHRRHRLDPRDGKIAIEIANDTLKRGCDIERVAARSHDELRLSPRPLRDRPIDLAGIGGGFPIPSAVSRVAGDAHDLPVERVDLDVLPDRIELFEELARDGLVDDGDPRSVRPIRLGERPPALDRDLERREVIDTRGNHLYAEAMSRPLRLRAANAESIRARRMRVGSAIHRRRSHDAGCAGRAGAPVARI